MSLHATCKLESMDLGGAPEAAQSLNSAPQVLNFGAGHSSPVPVARNDTYQRFHDLECRCHGLELWPHTATQSAGVDGYDESIRIPHTELAVAA
jgi:hypothetical protein